MWRGHQRWTEDSEHLVEASLILPRRTNLATIAGRLVLAASGHSRSLAPLFLPLHRNVLSTPRKRVEGERACSRLWASSRRRSLGAV